MKAMRDKLTIAGFLLATVANACIWWAVPCEWSRPYQGKRGPSWD